jgi:thiamine monophosphate synthase
MQRLAQHLDALEVRLRGADSEDEVEVERAQLLDQLGAGVDAQLQVNAGVGLAVGADGVGEHIEAGGVDHADAQAPAVTAGAGTEAVAELAYLGENALGKRKHFVPFGSEPALATGALEDHHAKPSLELGE